MKFHRNKLQLHRTLKEEYPNWKMQFYEIITEFIEFINRVLDLAKKSIFYMQMYIFLNDKVNKHNCRYLSAKKLQSGITVWFRP